jgi:metal-sulfur cluster biosynthetic enzyme
MTDRQAAESRLWEVLEDVEDPEFPISIVDMGLIVDLQLRDGRAEVKITFTAMGCPGMDMILEDIRERLLREPDVRGVVIDIVWDPIWTKDRLSEDGKAQLREWGISL